MASISVPCPKCSFLVPPPNAASNWISHRKLKPLVSSFNPGSSSVTGSTRFPMSLGPLHDHFPILKAQVQEVAVESSSNSSPLPSTKSETLPSNTKESGALEASVDQAGVTDSTLSSFLAEVSNLVKLVDSKDISELQLKKDQFELIIRKKEALSQPSTAATLTMQYPQAMLLPQPPALQHVVPSVPATPAVAAPALALPSPSKIGSKSSLPPLKSPMAGTFYQSPAPGEPPFVKVGDKVQKGQVVCIIEAMKLMNEIEADQSGTIAEILVENGKPVSLDTALFIIQP